MIKEKFFNNKISFIRIIFLYSLYITITFNFFVFYEINNNLQSSKESIFLISYFYTLVFLVLLFLLIIFFHILGFRYLLKPLIVILLIISSVSLYFKIYYGITLNNQIILSFQDALTEKNFSEIFELWNLRLLIFIIFLGITPSLPLLVVKIDYLSIKKELFTRLITIILTIAVLIILIAINYKNISLTARENKIAGREAIPHYAINSFFFIYKK